jgi:hypothetical protein
MRNYCKRMIVRVNWRRADDLRRADARVHRIFQLRVRQKTMLN